MLPAVLNSSRLARSSVQRFATAVHHITDTEGHYPSFASSIRHSNIVAFDSLGRIIFQKNVKDPYFIYGGDLTDRGIGDIELTEKLLDFKNRHPERVKLLVGNREASKSRFHIELNPRYIRERLARGLAPLWLQSRPHKTPLDAVRDHMIKNGESADDLLNSENYINSLSIEECQLIYLNWMLQHNLGCPHTFFYQAQQLADKLKCDISDISDYDVLKSILEQTAPSGLIGEYLKQTEIAVIIPNTGILAVHGGLTPSNIGRIPGMRLSDPIIVDAHSWIEQFNHWYRVQLNEWAESKHEDLPLQLQSASSRLHGFSMQIPAEYRSIVTASMLDEKRQFIPLPSSVCDYLQKNGIYTVLTGHQPCGDHPAIVRSDDNRLMFILADTGYANIKSDDIHDTRGDVAHTLQIYADPQKAQINIGARLLDGKGVNTHLDIVQGYIESQTHVGKLLSGNELVQCQLENGDYRTIHQKGFTVTYTIRTEEEINSYFDIPLTQMKSKAFY